MVDEPLIGHDGANRPSAFRCCCAWIGRFVNRTVVQANEHMYGDLPVAETRLTYRELAPGSRHRSRIRASEGHPWTLATAKGQRFLVDFEAEKAAHTPRRRPNEAVAKAEAVGEQYRQEADMAGKRVDHLVTELVEMSMQMAEQTAVADKVRAEFDAYRARPWWRRLARS
jgi:hypothetical protein